MNQSIYLASRSPRRAELLQHMGIGFDVLSADIDESILPSEPPETYVMRLAGSKAAVGLANMQQAKLQQRPVLAADTTVCVDGMILGKPENDDDAHVMLKRLSGRWHEVHTALALVSAAGVDTVLSTTCVELALLSDETIAAYIASGEPRDKAGAYGIQGLAGLFIKRIEGSYSGVMGLPLFETAQLLKNAGIKLL